jgi:hypothetical protein
MIFDIVETAKDNEFRRMGERVMVKHPNIPGVYYNGIDAQRFINQCLLHSPIFHKRAWMQSLEKWFKTQDHPQFPIILHESISKQHIAFLNGSLDIFANKFTPWKQLDTPPPFTDHFFEVEYTKADVATPLWDNMLFTQLQQDDEKETQESIDTMEAMTGRLLLPTGFDNLQVATFVLGDADTGKSTYINLVSDMLPIGSVGCISANQEQIFGLQGLHDKRLIVMPDVKKGFCKVLDQTVYQNMVSGDKVSVAVKGKNPIQIEKWQVPTLGCGNILPDWKDTSGQISRRMAVFRFETVVANKDPEMPRKIRENELVWVMLRCLRKYHDMRYRILSSPPNKRTYWLNVPQSLCDIRDSVSQSSNPLMKFMIEGDRRYQVVFKEGSCVSFTKFKSVFENYMAFTGKDYKYTLTKADIQPLKVRGFKLQTTNMCKVCHGKSSKKTCGPHYADGRNRKKLDVIHNMELVEVNK